MPRRKPSYECSFCGEELADRWEFSGHTCEPIAQLEIVLARIIQRFTARPPAAADPAAEALNQAKRRAAELIADLARKSGLKDAAAGFNWEDIAKYQSTFEQAYRAAKVAAHPDRATGAEELFKNVQAAAEVLKRHFGL